MSVIFCIQCADVAAKRAERQVHEIEPADDAEAEHRGPVRRAPVVSSQGSFVGERGRLGVRRTVHARARYAHRTRAMYRMTRA
jgi:hypothetical protein